MIPAGFTTELNDGDEAVILILRRPLVAVDMRGVPTLVAHQVAGNGDRVHSDIPVG